jgi:hypothetical protein
MVPLETCRAVFRYKLNCVTLDLVGYILEFNIASAFIV